MRRIHWSIWIIFGLCTVIEITLSSADNGWIASTNFRWIAYENYAFWVAAFDQQNVLPSAHLKTMFVSYAFLHAGPVHLGVNMISLVSIGDTIVRKAGATKFMVIYFIGLLGGAVGFGLISNSAGPMVGASGAIFGLLGAVVSWETSARMKFGQSLAPIFNILVVLAAFNLVIWWVTDGYLAWEAHLGGFVAGFAISVFLPPRHTSATNRTRNRFGGN